MAFIKSDKTIVVWILTVIAVIFGLLTIKAGGQVLFGGSTVAAMSLRSLVWLSIYIFSYRELIRR